MSSSVDDIFRQGVSALQAGHADTAERLFGQVLRKQPRHVGALNLLSVLLIKLERFDEAEKYVRLALKENSGSDATFYNYGLILKALKRPTEALQRFNEALAINPSIAETWNNRGTVFNDMKLYRDAIADFDKAISLNPRYAEAFVNKGKSLTLLRHLDEASAAFDTALALNPGLAEAWMGRGNVLLDLRRLDDALDSYDRALALKPEASEAWVGRAVVLSQFKRHKEAAEAYARILSIDPLHPFSKGALLHQKMSACDWSGIDELIAEIEGDLVAGKPAGEPFGWQGVATSPRSLQLCAELLNAKRYPAKAEHSRPLPAVEHAKIRIGYVSGELREQATSQLIVGVLERHDRSRFEIYAFDNGWNDHSEIRRRIEAAVSEIVDIRKLDDVSAAAAIAERQIDILVDLNGYFGEERTGIFAQRPAPVQVNYLGFPGTLGASYIDYIVADRCVIPPAEEAFYVEKIVALPDCYQANDDKKVMAALTPGRAECGLPPRAFVFCCFNNSYKITPDVFDCWMHILKHVDGSVLWLLEDNADAVANLRREASTRDVDPGRLMFAKRIALPDYLARQRLADLFLDTRPYNAHTTASDALWAGLPVLTRIGGTFPGRVAASLLLAIDLPELITATRNEYEDLAIELATDPAKLARIREKLAGNRLTKSLFNTPLFTRRIEAAYTAMYERYRSGLPPDHIYVQD
jgi:predicted O-linked N-acetylglucosamine transferase (SPINDLY family)